MSIIFQHEKGCLISHPKFINRMYKHTLISSRQTSHNFELIGDLFDINFPFKSLSDVKETIIDLKKRKRKSTLCVKLSSEAQYIKDTFENIVNSAKLKNLIPNKTNGKNVSPTCDENNKEAKSAAENCSAVSLCLRGLETCNGGNSSPHALLQSLGVCDVLFPANSRFFCGDVRNTLHKLNGEQFDTIIMDPPWWNKYIRRNKAKRPENSYEMMYNSEIANLSVDALLKPGGLIAVWCTNCTAHENYIKEVMFKRWNVHYKATWFWMKITKFGSPLCPFTESTGKKPYERIIIGIKNVPENQFDQPKDLPENYLVLSVPSAIHSHKPPLNDLLSPYTSEAKPKYLEIFARYLLSDTTSIGLEPLRFQHSDLFSKIS